jgi:hypothetical protein
MKRAHIFGVSLTAAMLGFRISTACAAQDPSGELQGLYSNDPRILGDALMRLKASSSQEQLVKARLFEIAEVNGATNDRLRSLTVHSLSNTGDFATNALPLFHKFAVSEHDSGSVRFLSLHALHRIAPDSTLTIDAMVRLLRSPTDLADAVLRILSEHTGSCTTNSQIISELVSFSDDPDRRKEVRALRALSNPSANNAEALKHLRARLNCSSQEHENEAIKRLFSEQPLTTMDLIVINDGLKDPKRRADIIATYRQLDDKVLPSIEAANCSRDPRVSAAANNLLHALQTDAITEKRPP